jgi:hypothetical protein
MKGVCMGSGGTFQKTLAEADGAKANETAAQAEESFEGRTTNLPATQLAP